MMLLKLTWQSLWNRRISLSLTIISIAISVSLLLGIEYIRKEARQSFMNTLSSTDLVVGARSGAIQLLLSSVFRIGKATNTISWESYQHIADDKRVKWTIPISLGDSHKGYSVLGTNTDYFNFYRYADKHQLDFSEGKAFTTVYDAVLGAEVAHKLGYQLGDKIVLSHGAGVTSFSSFTPVSEHKNKPFSVTGILKPTGTPVDQTVHVTLKGIEAIHVDWKSGAPVAGFETSAEEAAKMNLQPKTITAFLLGLNSRTATFRLQRKINDYPNEALLAVIPGVALAELWRAIGQFETILRIVSIFVLVAGLLGMLTALLTSLNERRREIALLRSLGVHPTQVSLLFILEAVISASLGSALGLLVLFTGILLVKSWVAQTYGLYLHTWLPQSTDWLLLLIIAGLAALFSLLPAWVAYRRSLQDGLTVKI